MGISLPDQTSETIAEAFVDKFICVLGAPKANINRPKKKLY